ncbi:MAG: dockerin type I domain-containing protein, partial [Planctomycetota bacterium]
SIDPSTLDFVDFENEFAAAALRLDGKIDFYLLNDPSFEGIIPFTYYVLDNEGLPSYTVTVTIVVSDTPYQNPVNPFNVDDDSSVSPLDVLAIINLLNARGASIPVDDLPDSTDYVDVNGDNQVDPLDVLALINFINAGGNTNRKGEGEGEGGEASRAGWQKSLHMDISPGAPILNIASIDGLSDVESKRQPARMLRSHSGSIVSHAGTPAPRFAERVFEGKERSIEHFDLESEERTRDTDLVDRVFEELFLDRCA